MTYTYKYLIGGIMDYVAAALGGCVLGWILGAMFGKIFAKPLASRLKPYLIKKGMVS
jgi:hypothetical protein